MVYPSFIQKSNQDKLKISILEFSSRFAGGKPTEGQKKRLIDSNKPKRSDYGTNRNERSNYLAALRKYNANKGTKETNTSLKISALGGISSFGGLGAIDGFNQALVTA